MKRSIINFFMVLCFLTLVSCGQVENVSIEEGKTLEDSIDVSRQQKEDEFNKLNERYEQLKSDYQKLERDIKDKQKEFDELENGIIGKGQILRDLNHAKSFAEEELNELINQKNDELNNSFYQTKPIIGRYFENEQEAIDYYTTYYQPGETIYYDGKKYEEYYYGEPEEDGFRPRYHVTKILDPETYVVNQNGPTQGDWSFEIGDRTFNNIARKYNIYR